MTTDELNAIVQAVMLEMEKAGVDFDFKAETPQADDLVYVMRGTADRYMGITVKWQNLLDIIVQKATEAKNEAVSAKDIALQTLATIQGIESNVSSMKSSVETSEANVASMKASIETSESNVTQMKSDVSTMKASVEGTKTEVEGLKEETAGLLNTKADKTYVDGELAKKVSHTDSLTYEEIMATTDLTNKVASANALKEIATLDLLWENASPTSEYNDQRISMNLTKYKFVYILYILSTSVAEYIGGLFKPNIGRMNCFTMNPQLRYRNVTVSNTGISFNEGWLVTGVTSENKDNNQMIPYKIYGVK